MSKSDLIISKHTRTVKQLQRLQALPLEQKVNLSLRRISQFYTEMNGKVYIAFSGGKDSTVLLHLVRSLFPEVKAVFANTGVEFPEIVSFVRTIENVTEVKPKISFPAVLKKYGFPMISKNVAMGFARYRNTKSDLQKSLRLHGGINPTSGKKQNRTIPKKYHFLLNENIKISDKCCHVLKEYPMYKYGRETKSFPFTGTMAEESNKRQKGWLSNGCNSFKGNMSISHPLAFWKEKNILEYIKIKRIPISEIYKTEERTGCMFCLFGCQFKGERGAERIDRLKDSHPKHYKAAIYMGIIDALELIRPPSMAEDHKTKYNRITKSEIRVKGSYE